MDFKNWLKINEIAPTPGATTPGAPMLGAPDVKTKVKQAILQQSGGRGPGTPVVAQRELQKASQAVAADPNADIDTAIDIGSALDKTQGKMQTNPMLNKGMRR